MLPFPSRFPDCLAAMLLAIPPLFAAEKPIDLPVELQFGGEEIAKDKNGLAKLLEHLEKPTPELSGKIRQALDQLRAGKAVEDAALLEELRERHLTAERWLKPPVQCLRQTISGPFISVVFNLFRGAEILSRQSAIEGDHDAARNYLATMLEWSRLIRKGRPTEMEAMIGHAGWRIAFTCALQEWESVPDQEAGLAKLADLFAKNRIPRGDWADVVRRDAQWWADQGGTKGCLDGFPAGQPLTLLFKEPFAKLTPEQVRELPYDETAELARQTALWSGQLRCLQEDQPLEKWPDFRHKDFPGLTLEDYRKRPNGLGDLLDEQSDKLVSSPALGSFFTDAAMETCLNWLKAEQSDKTFSPDATNTGRDPMNGKLLQVDTAHRSIRSVGVDLKLEERASPPALSGFSSMDPHNPTLWVPKWRERH